MVGQNPDCGCQASDGNGGNHAPIAKPDDSEKFCVDPRCRSSQNGKRKTGAMGCSATHSIRDSEFHARLSHHDGYGMQSYSCWRGRAVSVFASTIKF